MYISQSKHCQRFEVVRPEGSADFISIAPNDVSFFIGVTDAEARELIAKLTEALAQPVEVAKPAKAAA